MKRLICAGLYYNMIMALSFRLNVFNDEDEVDLVLENTGTDADIIIENVRRTGLFSHVYVYDIKSRIAELERKGKIGIVFDKIKHYCFPKFCEGNFGFPMKYYDEYYGMNMEAPIRVSYMSNLRRINPNIKFFQFDEGVGTLARGSFSLSGTTLKYKICKLFNRYLPSKKDISALYLAAPEWKFFDDNIEIRKITFPVARADFRNAVSKIYNIDLTKISKYRAYILQSCDVEKDYGLFSEAVESFGKDNVLVKLHPRETARKSRFENDGVDVLRGSIPWELLAMNIDDIDDKVLIAVSSGAVINTKVLLNAHCKIIFLYKLDVGFAKEAIFESDLFAPFVEKLLKTFPNEIWIPDTLDEYRKILAQLSK